MGAYFGENGQSFRRKMDTSQGTLPRPTSQPIFVPEHALNQVSMECLLEQRWVSSGTEMTVHFEVK